MEHRTSVREAVVAAASVAGVCVCVCVHVHAYACTCVCGMFEHYCMYTKHSAYIWYMT